MSWKNLKDALNKMKPAGPDGYEGFVGQLLGSLLNQPFLAAQGGEQPGGDGRSHDGSVRFQTKHYTVAKIDNFDIINDFHRVRAAYPSMETYVLGTVFEINEQLRSSLDVLETQFGVEIVSLDYATESSPLALLTIEFWTLAQQFAPLNRLDAPTQEWIKKRQEDETFKRQIGDLRNAINLSTRLFGTLRAAAIQRLNERFGRAPRPGTERFEIFLDKSVPRTSLETNVSAWRKTTKNSLLVFEGEEGMGKSWAAAGFASTWMKEANSAVLWLDSHEWAGIEGVSQLIGYAIERLPIAGVAEWSHWKRKAASAWAGRLTIVLDGANEGQALVTAQALVAEVRNGRRETPRIVFTTRPLARLHLFSGSVWRSVSKCEVHAFDDSEFDAALSKLDKPMRRDEIPAPLEPWARIPRLLKTCSLLRDQFGGLTHVTREMILWAELLEKIKATDPQVRQTLGWRENEEAADVLARLARRLRESKSGELPSDQLNQFFTGEFKDVIVALEELRLADKAQKMKTQVNPDCNLLGLALLLHERLRLPPASAVRAQSDQLHKFLEPLAEVDERSNALLIALQLTVLSPTEAVKSLSHQRSALLHAWATSHNADVATPPLQFWAFHDAMAYAGFVEALFEQPLADTAVDLVLVPLARCWRDDANARQTLGAVLRRWLLLTWPDSEAILSVEISRQGHSLPVARSEAQLKLTLAAIAAISSHPVQEMLPSLALSRATLEDAISTWMIPKTPAPSSELTPHTRQLKMWGSNFAALMRFGFTESCVPELARLAEAHQGNAAMLKGLQQLARSLRLNATPALLQLPPSQPSYLWKGVAARMLMREQRRLFPADPDDFRVQEDDFSYLAVRDDLPEMLPGDRAHIARALESAMASAEFESRDRSMTQEDYLWKRFHVWYAKHSPQQLLRRMSEFRGQAFTSPEPLRALSVAEDFLHDPSVISSNALLERAKTFASEQLDPADRKAAFLGFRLHHLALLNFSPEELVDWFNFAAEHAVLRDEISHYPSTPFLRALLPPEVALRAHAAIRENVNELPPAGERANGRFDFWSRLAAAAAEPSDEVFDWCFAQIQQLQPVGDRRFHWGIPGAFASGHLNKVTISGDGESTPSRSRRTRFLLISDQMNARSASVIESDGSDPDPPPSGSLPAPLSICAKENVVRRRTTAIKLSFQTGA